MRFAHKNLRYSALACGFHQLLPASEVMGQVDFFKRYFKALKKVFCGATIAAVAGGVENDLLHVLSGQKSPGLRPGLGVCSR